MKILFIVPYPIGEAPSQRFRFEQYFNSLSNKGHTYHISSFLNTHNWRLFYKSGYPINKTFALMQGFATRMLDCFKALRYDFIFIHREGSPIGPPFFEWILTKLLQKKIIYDFDDAIWLTDKLDEGRLEKLLRWRSKVSSICKWSYRISCGNAYLADYARQFNNNVIINPTTIDTELVHNPEKLKKITDHVGSNLQLTEKTSLVIGWTGSHSTLKYLKSLEEVLIKIELKYEQVSFIVIADRKPEMMLKRLNFVQWNKDSEAADLFKLDIGIMPLPDDEWTKGKCGFKALQYMALGIPPVASPIGVNTTIIQHGVNGYLAKTNVEWLHALTELIEQKELREKLGKEAIKTVENHYSVNANKERFLNLFNQH